MAATYCVFGDMGFNNTPQRNTANTTIQAEAAARGLVGEAVFPGYPAGTLAYVNDVASPALKFCYVGTDKDVIDEAVAAMQAYIETRGFVNGVIGTVYVRD